MSMSDSRPHPSIRYDNTDLGHIYYLCQLIYPIAPHNRYEATFHTNFCIHGAVRPPTCERISSWSTACAVRNDQSNKWTGHSFEQLTRHQIASDATFSSPVNVSRTGVPKFWIPKRVSPSKPFEECFCDESGKLEACEWRAAHLRTC
jgi:hypothetical protein